MNVPGKKSTQASEVTDITKTQRLIDIAKRRGATLSDILRHDLLTKDVLFDSDFTVKPAKHVMIKNLRHIWIKKKILHSRKSQNFLPVFL